MTEGPQQISSGFISDLVWGRRVVDISVYMVQISHGMEWKTSPGR